MATYKYTVYEDGDPVGEVEAPTAKEALLDFYADSVITISEGRADSTLACWGDLILPDGSTFRLEALNDQ